MQAARKNVIAVDFAGRRRMRERLPDTPAVATAREIIGQSRDFLLFWRPPGRRAAAEYLGSKWDWGWTLFVWTSEATVGPMRAAAIQHAQQKMLEHLALQADTRYGGN